MNETMATSSYHFTGTYSAEKPDLSALNMDTDIFYDTDSEIASQILASFRESLQHREKTETSDNNMDKLTYHNMDSLGLSEAGYTVTQEPFGITSDGNNDIDSQKVFKDLPFLKSPSAQNMVDNRHVFNGEALANHHEAYRSHDAWSPDEAGDYNFQIKMEEAGVVSSTKDTDLSPGTMTGLDNVNWKFSFSEKKSDKTYQKKNHELPPCRVCGYKASGFHYGANTCEACKGFFRRSLKKDSLEYKCITGDNSCVIQKGRRNNCPLCRYNKCLDVGMSKDAIKTGRYTHEKRTQDIIEVKGLKGDSAPNLLTSKPNSIKIKEERVLGEEHLNLISRIYQAHRLLFPRWHSMLDSGMLPTMHRDYAEKYRLKRKTQALDGYLKDEVKSADADGRMQRMDLLTKHLELAIMTFVKFAKSIPGFCELPLNDQATLVKTSRFEVWMIGAHKFVSKEYNVVVGPRGNAFHADELSEVLEGSFVRKLFDFSAVLQEIDLTNEEVAIMKCIVLTFSDRCDLEEPEMVERIQWELVACLQAQLNNIRKFSQVMNAFVTLRDLTEWNKRISENLILEWPTIQHNPLLMEVMNI